MATNKDNQRIAQNAFYLYIRMFITMIISLFTSRVVLNTLGETDYGIYNIVGGIVVLFSFLNAALTTATQRFFSYELGKKDLKSLQRIFSISMTCYIFLSLAILILSESIGLWFLNNYLNIPNNRIASANWVYQFSIIAFIFQMIRIPYHSTIISYEKMNFFALISIIEVSLKLLIVYVLLILLIDKLILYSILMTVVILVITLSYKFYCNKYFTTTKYYFYWNRNNCRSYEPILLKNIFRNKTYVEIQQRSYYLPSIILFDYSDYGFSDEFIRRNSKVFSKFYYN